MRKLKLTTTRVLVVYVAILAVINAGLLVMLIGGARQAATTPTPERAAWPFPLPTPFPYPFTTPWPYPIMIITPGPFTFPPLPSPILPSGPPPITLPSGPPPPSITPDYAAITMTVAAYPSPDPTYQIPPR